MGLGNRSVGARSVHLLFDLLFFKTFSFLAESWFLS